MPITWSVLRWMDPWPGGYRHKTSGECGSFESEKNICEQTCHYDIAGTVCPPAAWTGARVSTPGVASRVSTSLSLHRFTLHTLSTISISTISIYLLCVRQVVAAAPSVFGTRVSLLSLVTGRLLGHVATPHSGHVTCLLLHRDR